MAFRKNYTNEIFGTVLVLSALLSTASAVDCYGKSFHCVNSTHFMICVDLGGGVSQSIDNFVIPCPPPTVCQGNNHFECEFPVSTTPSTTLNDVISETTQPWEEIAVTTNSELGNTTKEYSEKYMNTISITVAEDSFTKGATAETTTEIYFSNADVNDSLHVSRTEPIVTESLSNNTTVGLEQTPQMLPDNILQRASVLTTEVPLVQEQNNTPAQESTTDNTTLGTSVAEPTITETDFNSLTPNATTETKYSENTNITRDNSIDRTTSPPNVLIIRSSTGAEQTTITTTTDTNLIGVKPTLKTLQSASSRNVTQNTENITGSSGIPSTKDVTLLANTVLVESSVGTEQPLTTAINENVFVGETQSSRNVTKNAENINASSGIPPKIDVVPLPANTVFVESSVGTEQPLITAINGNILIGEAPSSGNMTQNAENTNGSSGVASAIDVVTSPANTLFIESNVTTEQPLTTAINENVPIGEIQSFRNVTKNTENINASSGIPSTTDIVTLPANTVFIESSVGTEQPLKTAINENALVGKSPSSGNGTKNAENINASSGVPSTIDVVTLPANTVFVDNSVGTEQLLTTAINENVLVGESQSSKNVTKNAENMNASSGIPSTMIDVVTLPANTVFVESSVGTEQPLITSIHENLLVDESQSSGNVTKNIENLNSSRGIPSTIDVVTLPANTVFVESSVGTEQPLTTAVNGNLMVAKSASSGTVTQKTENIKPSSGVPSTVDVVTLPANTVFVESSVGTEQPLTTAINENVLVSESQSSGNETKNAANINGSSGVASAIDVGISPDNTLFVESSVTTEQPLTTAVNENLMVIESAFSGTVTQNTENTKASSGVSSTIEVVTLSTNTAFVESSVTTEQPLTTAINKNLIAVESASSGTVTQNAENTNGSSGVASAIDVVTSPANTLFIESNVTTEQPLTTAINENVPIGEIQSFRNVTKNTENINASSGIPSTTDIVTLPANTVFIESSVGTEQPLKTAINENALVGKSPSSGNGTKNAENINASSGVPSTIDVVTLPANTVFVDNSVGTEQLLTTAINENVLVGESQSSKNVTKNAENMNASSGIPSTMIDVVTLPANTVFVESSVGTEQPLITSIHENLLVDESQSSGNVTKNIENLNSSRGIPSTIDVVTLPANTVFVESSVGTEQPLTTAVNGNLMVAKSASSGTVTQKTENIKPSSGVPSTIDIVTLPANTVFVESSVRTEQPLTAINENILVDESPSSGNMIQNTENINGSSGVASAIDVGISPDNTLFVESSVTTEQPLTTAVNENLMVIESAFSGTVTQNTENTKASSGVSSTIEVVTLSTNTAFVESSVTTEQPLTTAINKNLIAVESASFGTVTQNAENINASSGIPSTIDVTLPANTELVKSKVGTEQPLTTAIKESLLEGESTSPGNVTQNTENMNGSSSVASVIDAATSPTNTLSVGSTTKQQLTTAINENFMVVESASSGSVTENTENTKTSSGVPSTIEVVTLPATTLFVESNVGSEHSLTTVIKKFLLEGESSSPGNETQNTENMNGSSGVASPIDIATSPSNTLSVKSSDTTEKPLTTAINQNLMVVESASSGTVRQNTENIKASMIELVTLPVNTVFVESSVGTEQSLTTAFKENLMVVDSASSRTVTQNAENINASSDTPSAIDVATSPANTLFVESSVRTEEPLTTAINENLLVDKSLSSGNVTNIIALSGVSSTIDVVTLSTNTVLFESSVGTEQLLTKKIDEGMVGDNDNLDLTTVSSRATTYISEKLENINTPHKDTLTELTGATQPNFTKYEENITSGASINLVTEQTTVSTTDTVQNTGHYLDTSTTVATAYHVNNPKILDAGVITIHTPIKTNISTDQSLTTVFDANLTEGLTDINSTTIQLLDSTNIPQNTEIVNASHIETSTELKVGIKQPNLAILKENMPVDAPVISVTQQTTVFNKDKMQNTVDYKFPTTERAIAHSDNSKTTIDLVALTSDTLFTESNVGTEPPFTTIVSGNFKVSENIALTMKQSLDLIKTSQNGFKVHVNPTTDLGIIENNAGNKQLEPAALKETLISKTLPTEESISLKTDSGSTFNPVEVNAGATPMVNEVSQTKTVLDVTTDSRLTVSKIVPTANLNQNDVTVNETAASLQPNYNSTISIEFTPDKLPDNDNVHSNLATAAEKNFAIQGDNVAGQGVQKSPITILMYLKTETLSVTNKVNDTNLNKKIKNKSDFTNPTVRYFKLSTLDDLHVTKPHIGNLDNGAIQSGNNAATITGISDSLANTVTQKSVSLGNIDANFNADTETQRTQSAMEMIDNVQFNEHTPENGYVKNATPNLLSKMNEASKSSNGVPSTMMVDKNDNKIVNVKVLQNSKHIIDSFTTNYNAVTGGQTDTLPTSGGINNLSNKLERRLNVTESVTNSAIQSEEITVKDSIINKEELYPNNGMSITPPMKSSSDKWNIDNFTPITTNDANHFTESISIIKSSSQTTQENTNANKDVLFEYSTTHVPEILKVNGNKQKTEINFKWENTKSSSVPKDGGINLHLSEVQPSSSPSVTNDTFNQSESPVGYKDDFKPTKLELSTETNKKEDIFKISHISTISVGTVDIYKSSPDFSKHSVSNKIQITTESYKSITFDSVKVASISDVNKTGDHTVSTPSEVIALPSLQQHAINDVKMDDVSTSAMLRANSARPSKNNNVPMEITTNISSISSNFAKTENTKTQQISGNTQVEEQNLEITPAVHLIYSTPKATELEKSEADKKIYSNDTKHQGNNSKIVTKYMNVTQPDINGSMLKSSQNDTTGNNIHNKLKSEQKFDEYVLIKAARQAKSTRLPKHEVRTMTTTTTQATTSSYTQKPVSPVTDNPSQQVPNDSSSTYTCINGIRGRYSDKNDCRKFYICIGKNQPIIGNCPVNTVFSDIKKLCTKNMSHCIRDSQFKCPSAGRFSDFIKNDVYYICVDYRSNLYRFKFQCQKGFTLDKITVRCIENIQIEPNESVSISSGDNDSDSNSSKTSGSSNSSGSSNNSSGKSDSSNKSSSSSSDSSNKNNKSNGDGSSSDSSSSKTKKSKEKKVTKEEPERKEEKEDEDEVFECEEEGKFPVRNDCRKYYLCKKHRKHYRRKIKKCESGDVFHKDKKKCVDADSYEC